MKFEVEVEKGLARVRYSGGRAIFLLYYDEEEVVVLSTSGGAVYDLKRERVPRPVKRIIHYIEKGDLRKAREELIDLARRSLEKPLLEVLRT